MRTRLDTHALTHNTPRSCAEPTSARQRRHRQRRHMCPRLPRYGEDACAPESRWLCELAGESMRCISCSSARGRSRKRTTNAGFTPTSSSSASMRCTHLPRTHASAHTRTRTRTRSALTHHQVHADLHATLWATALKEVTRQENRARCVARFRKSAEYCQELQTPCKYRGPDAGDGRPAYKTEAARVRRAFTRFAART